MNPLSGKLSFIYQKNAHVIDSLILRRAPGFVYRSTPEPLTDDIPVFTFHTALPDRFEQQCRHLAENGYATIHGDELLDALAGKTPVARRSVMIAFDDGLKHVWTVAYPLLKKYGLKAVCFVIPGCIDDGDRRVRPTIEDVWRGTARMEDILRLGPGESLASWEELRIMHDSGILDVQSHTHYHNLVHVSDRIVDFFSPAYNPHYYGNVHVPVFSEDGRDNIARTPALGQPIYEARPRMAAARRYFDDEALRRRCIETVERGGGAAFFDSASWRKRLHQVVADYRAGAVVTERYETESERDTALRLDLAAAKAAIERQLPGKTVRHLCYPWYEAGDFAVRASVRAGYAANYFGLRKGRTRNRPGDDPLGIVRIEDLFLQRLPGKGRERLSDIVRRLIALRRVPSMLGLSPRKEAS